MSYVRQAAQYSLPGYYQSLVASHILKIVQNSISDYSYHDEQ